MTTSRSSQLCRVCRVTCAMRDVPMCVPCRRDALRSPSTATCVVIINGTRTIVISRWSANQDESWTDPSQVPAFTRNLPWFLPKSPTMTHRFETKNYKWQNLPIFQTISSNKQNEIHIEHPKTLNQAMVWTNDIICSEKIISPLPPVRIELTTPGLREPVL